jgi:hypothetical protein
MAVYVFQLCNVRGEAPSFEAHELAQDSQTYLKAGQLLREHPSCDHVEVWDGDRGVLARHRQEPSLRPIRPYENSRSA